MGFPKNELLFMIKKWLSWINILVGSLAIALVAAAISFWMMRPGDIPVLEAPHAKTELPKSSFTYPKQAYDAIGAPVFSLQFSPLSVQLPDIKRFLVYYGKNGRPDANLSNTLLHFAFTGNKTPSSVAPGQRLYILYDKKASPAQYVFSPNNAETPLWIEATSEGSEAVVQVAMKDEKGEIIRQPAAYAKFTLPEKEFVRFGGAPWELGKFRVDGTLLARQKARWFGLDRFLEKHGGPEFSHVLGKQRIDFGEGADIYSVFVGIGDAMIWNKDKWKVVQPGADSLGHPLLVVKKIDDRLMSLEIWDVEGKGKITINLLKSSETWIPQNIQKGFKFMGARTRSQFVFEINKERMLLRPQDWLLLTDKGWKKLVTPQEIDDYVERKTTGPMFVFDGVDRKDDGLVMMGTLFNAPRTDAQPIEINVQQTTTPAAGDKKADKKSETKRAMHPDEDDDIDDDDMEDDEDDLLPPPPPYIKPRPPEGP